ncbi:MAG: hypothetical protein MUP24_14445 [Gillisia sp.]|nr:hypothetical protein [Gillisia sp.]
MKRTLFTFVLLFTFLTILGQEKLAEISTGNAVYEMPGLDPTHVFTKLSWKVYQDSIVMSYVGEEMLRRFDKTGESAVMVYYFPLNKESNTYTYQGDDIRIRLVRTEKKDVITVVRNDNFSGDISKVMYY